MGRSQGADKGFGGDVFCILSVSAEPVGKAVNILRVLLVKIVEVDDHVIKILSPRIKKVTGKSICLFAIALRGKPNFLPEWVF